MATDQNLILNILTFDHPVETAEFSFSTDMGDGLFPVDKDEWPVNISDYFPQLNANVQYLYVNFNPIPEERKLTINFHNSPRFSKHYYSWIIYNHFKEVSCILNSNFVKDTAIMLYDKDASAVCQFFIFKRFVIKVQINQITDFPELVISYEGKTKVLKEGLDKINVPIETIKHVIYDHKVIPYDKLTDDQKQDLSKIRPILSNPMGTAMKLKWEPEKVRNKLKRYFDEITPFVNKYLNTTAFLAKIPLHSTEFITIPENKIFKTNEDSNKLIFGNNAENLNPFYGILYNGPFRKSPLPKIEFFLIFHQKDRPIVEKLITWIDGTALKGIKGMRDFIKMSFYLNIDKSIIFNNLDNPMPEIKQKLSDWPFVSGTTYLGIYITPFNKEIIDKTKRSLYYKVKYELLKYRVTSQVIETDTILEEGFRYSLPNIAIAILAKLKGIPWRLQRTLNHELIVGVGAFKSKSLNTRYIGSAFCFKNDGSFQGFDCYSARSTYMLAGSIRDAVINYIEKFETVERLIIHFYKKMSLKKDFQPILDVLHGLGLDIPVIVISVNKTESHEMVIFDKSCHEIIPDSGTFIRIDKHQILLCNNSRYGSSMPGKNDAYHFPVRLHIQSTDEKLLENDNLINDLIDQVYQFSRMYWKSVSQQNLPVTVKYPELVAEKYPHFESTNIPDFGKENLWFL